MRTDDSRAAMAEAFRETALSLVGLFQVYEVDSSLSEATADALGTVFRRHLRKEPAPSEAARVSALHALVDELDRADSMRSLRRKEP